MQVAIKTSLGTPNSAYPALNSFPETLSPHLHPPAKWLAQMPIQTGLTLSHWPLCPWCLTEGSLLLHSHHYHPSKVLFTLFPLGFCTHPLTRPAAPACFLASIIHTAPLGIFQNRKPLYPVSGLPLGFRRKFKHLCSLPSEVSSLTISLSVAFTGVTGTTRSQCLQTQEGPSPRNTSICDSLSLWRQRHSS